MSGYYRDSGIEREFREDPALGFLELSSISRGLFLTDAVLKKAPVRVIASQPISSGKHVLLYAGDVAAVSESHQTAIENGDGTIVKQILIPGIHPGLTPFLDSLWSESPSRGPANDAVAIIESTTLAGAVLAADSALKAADVSLMRLRLGQGIGGKAYFIVTGSQSEVEAATDAARARLSELGSLCRSDVIPRPQDDALIHF